MPLRVISVSGRRMERGTVRRGPYAPGRERAGEPAFVEDGRAVPRPSRLRSLQRLCLRRDEAMREEGRRVSGSSESVGRWVVGGDDRSSTTTTTTNATTTTTTDNTNATTTTTTTTTERQHQRQRQHQRPRTSSTACSFLCVGQYPLKHSCENGASAAGTAASPAEPQLLHALRARAWAARGRGGRFGWIARHARRATDGRTDGRKDGRTKPRPHPPRRAMRRGGGGGGGGSNGNRVERPPRSLALYGRGGRAEGCIAHVRAHHLGRLVAPLRRTYEDGRRAARRRGGGRRRPAILLVATT